MVLHHLVCNHCLDMLPCKIWSLQLQKCQSYANFSIIWFGIVWFGYVSIWFSMVLHHLVCDHCPDMLPCKIWIFQLQKYPSYDNFTIIWFGMVWFGYIQVWFGMVLHHLLFDCCPDMLPCKIWSLYLQKCQSYASFSLIWFGKVWFSYVSVWFGMVLHHLVCDHCPDILPYKIWSLQIQKCPRYAHFRKFGLV